MPGAQGIGADLLQRGCLRRGRQSAPQRGRLQGNRRQGRAQFMGDFTGQLALALQRVLLLAHQLVDGTHD